MSKLRVVFMGTPDFAVPCLDMLVKENYDIVAVITQPDRPKGRGQKLAQSPVKEAALAYGLKVMQPLKVKDAEFQAKLSALKPDIIIVVAFGQLLPKTILDLPPLGCINVHASLLPEYRGAAPIHWAVINGDKITGVTTMYMDVGMDTGDMILKDQIAIDNDATTGEIHDKLKLLGAEVLAKTVTSIINGNAPREPQNHQAATYAPMLKRATEKINWDQSCKDIHNMVRGLSPWPGTYCLLNSKVLKIWNTKLAISTKTGKPGQILEISPQGIIIQTGAGSIEILEVQPESKRRMSAKDYVCGYGLKIGDILE